MEQWKTDPYWDAIISYVLVAIGIIASICILHALFTKPNERDPSDKEDH